MRRSSAVAECVFTDDGRFQIDENSPWDMFASASFTEEGIERVISATDRFVRWHLTVRLNAMFETVQFPARITDLNTGLTDVDRNTFAHLQTKGFVVEGIDGSKHVTLLYCRVDEVTSEKVNVSNDERWCAIAAENNRQF